MATYFFDTSGLIKRHLNEAGSRWVRSLTDVRSGHAIFIARIAAVEMVAAITRRQRGGGLTPAQAGAFLGHFRRHLASRYFVLDVTPALLDDAMRLARSHGLRAYDSVQLSAALSVDLANRRVGNGPVPLISADRELNAAALAEGLAVDDPSSH